jgi:hypothetical protein
LANKRIDNIDAAGHNGIVTVMDENEQDFINQQYYPKDLVHQKIEHPKKKGLLGRLGL